MRTCKKYANGQSRGGGKFPRQSAKKSYVKSDEKIISLGRYPYPPKADHV